MWQSPFPPAECARIQYQPRRRKRSVIIGRRGRRSQTIASFSPLWFCFVLQPEVRKTCGKFLYVQLQHLRRIGIDFALLHGQTTLPGDEIQPGCHGVRRLGDAPQRELLRHTVAPSHRQVATKARDLASSSLRPTRPSNQPGRPGRSAPSRPRPSSCGWRLR